MNTEMHAMNLHAVLPTITAYPFYQWFIWIGGAGTTLPIPFMLLFSKNKHLKNVGKISLIPSLFNVNEPLIFGIPIVANPIFLIPFILAFSSQLIAKLFFNQKIDTLLLAISWIAVIFLFLGILIIHFVKIN